jgi:hypothetical protein
MPMKMSAAEADNKSLTIDCRALRGEKTRATGRFNGFFANSVNSPSVSMVNFSCCVRFALDVTRGVAAQPTRSAVRMETGVHAGV